MGRMKELPPLKVIHGKVDEFTRDPETDARHESIPLDLLYTTMEDDFLHVRILTRAKANPAERAEIRKRTLYLRYLLGKAFKGYRVDQIDLKLAFYLDHGTSHSSWHGSDSLFHPEEWIDRTRFWNDLCPGADPEKLFARIRGAATKGLKTENVVAKLKKHFNRTTKESH